MGLIPGLTQITNVRLEELLRAEKLLHALEDAGVDNWEGYGEALRSLSGDDE